MGLPSVCKKQTLGTNKFAGPAPVLGRGVGERRGWQPSHVGHPPPASACPAWDGKGGEAGPERAVPRGEVLLAPCHAESSGAALAATPREAQTT